MLSYQQVCRSLLWVEEDEECVAVLRVSHQTTCFRSALAPVDDHFDSLATWTK